MAQRSGGRTRFSRSGGRKIRGPVLPAAIATMAMLVVGCSARPTIVTAVGDPPGSARPGLLPAPVEPEPPLLDEAKVPACRRRPLDGIVGHIQWTRPGNPASPSPSSTRTRSCRQGYGVRKVGEPETIDRTPCSRWRRCRSRSPRRSWPASSERAGRLDRPGEDGNPDFELADPYVTEQRHARGPAVAPQRTAQGAATCSRTSGGIATTSSASVDQLPLHPFRAPYDYSNFGITEGGVGRRRRGRAVLGGPRRLRAVRSHRHGQLRATATPTTRRGTTRR